MRVKEKRRTKKIIAYSRLGFDETSPEYKITIIRKIKTYVSGNNYDRYLGLSETKLKNKNGKILRSSVQKQKKATIDKNGTMVQIASGASHHAALSQAGKVYLWQSNALGQRNIKHDGVKYFKKLCINDHVIKSISSWESIFMWSRCTWTISLMKVNDVIDNGN